MAPARRIVPIVREDVDDVRSTAQSSGIQLKDGAAAHVVIDLRIPPLDPLPRIAPYEEDDDASESEVIVVNAPKAITSERGVPIAIAPSAASVSVLSSRPSSTKPALFVAPNAEEAEDLLAWGIPVAVFIVVLLAVTLLARDYFG